MSPQRSGNWSVKSEVREGRARILANGKNRLNTLKHEMEERQRLSVSQLRSRFERTGLIAVPTDATASALTNQSMQNVQTNQRNHTNQANCHFNAIPLIVTMQEIDSQMDGLQDAEDGLAEIDAIIARRLHLEQDESTRLDKLRLQADEEYARALHLSFQQAPPPLPPRNASDQEMAQRLAELFKHEEDVERHLMLQEQARLDELEARKLQVLLNVEAFANDSVAARQKIEQEERDAAMAEELQRQLMEELSHESSVCPPRPPTRLSPSPSRTSISEDSAMYTYLGLTEESIALVSSQLRVGNNVRHHAIADAYVSEHAFFHSLYLLYQVWPINMKAIGISKTTLERIFPPELNNMLQLHRDLFTALHKIILEELDPFESKTAMIGPVFLDLKQQWSIYMRYIQSFDLADMTISSLSKNVKFQKLDESATRADDMKNRSLKENVFIPIQRLQRYPLVLKEILKNTPVIHADYALLEQALEQMNALASVVDTVRDLEEQRRRLILAWAEMAGFPPHLLSASKRKWLAEADVSLDNRKLHVVLLSDCLIVAKRLKMVGDESSGKKYRFIRALDLRRIDVCPVTADVDPTSLTFVFLPTSTMKNSVLTTLQDDVSCIAEKDLVEEESFGSLLRKKTRFFSKPSTPELDSNVPEILRLVWEKTSTDLFPEKSRLTFEKTLQEQIGRLVRFGLHL